ncbi:hypothetical protein ACFSJ3_03780 [Corallincola platygyrae]|uniref:Uncharacterized protein n=1 Tax=Corallincola platygyrae TaxID=1193278 RepID=A0ABW4XHU1_9GAMM
MEWKDIAPWIEGVLAIALVLWALWAAFRGRYLISYFNPNSDENASQKKCSNDTGADNLARGQGADEPFMVASAIKDLGEKTKHKNHR